jgi:hypothetical protein
VFKIPITGTDVISEYAEEVRTQEKVLPGYSPLLPKRNLKITDFCRHNNVKRFTYFTLKPKSATEMGC